MLKNARDKRICKKYSERDENNYVHCYECPLVIDKDLIMCKANSHYNRHTRQWEEDEYQKNYKDDEEEID